MTWLRSPDVPVQDGRQRTFVGADGYDRSPEGEEHDVPCSHAEVTPRPTCERPMLRRFVGDFARTHTLLP